MSKPGDVGGTSGVKGAPQGMRAPVSEAEAKELLKPIVFGNYQRHFKIFTTVVSAAMAYYLVFNHDFGPKRHVFTWLREWKERKTKEIFYIDPHDKEVQRMRERKEAATNERDKENSEQSSARLTSQQPVATGELKDSR